MLTISFLYQENLYVSRIEPHTPGKVKIRQSIIYKEIMKELNEDAEIVADKTIEESKELLEVDRKVISLGRSVISNSKVLKHEATLFPPRAKEFSAKSMEFSKEAMRHLGEAKNLKELCGIGLYEMRTVLMGAQDNITRLRESSVLDGVISWMVSKSIGCCM